jgi:hypothetical membrane protein
VDLRDHHKNTYMVVAPMAFVVFLVGLVLTLTTTPPSWDLAKENLSNLAGETSLLTGIMFTVTCMLAGIMIVYFGLGKAMYEEGLDNISGILFVISGVSLALVGLFNTNVYRLHMVVTLFFTFMVVFAIVGTSLADIKSGDRVMLAIHLATLILVLFQIPFFTGGAAELMSIVFGALWAECQLIKYYRRGLFVKVGERVSADSQAE